MMNDRFTAGLRQHLLDSANERPADGQLAAILDRVAVTAQRPRLVARLAWFPGRIGPFPSTAVRLALIAAALFAATLATSLFGGGGAGPSRSTVFEGTWIATDPGDGSRQTLDVNAGMTPAVHYEDAFSTGGACVADEVKVFTADGRGQIFENRLAVTYPAGGGCGMTTVPIETGVLDYDAATDTLLASDGVRWFRARQDGARPTPLPAIVASPRPESACLDLHGGGSYEASVGSLTLTATLPASTSWEGLPDSFLLSRFGCPDPESPVWVEAQVVTQVGPDACDRSGPALEVATAAEAISALAAQASIGGPDSVDATLDGYAGSQLEMSQSADFDASTCTDGVLAPLNDISSLDPGNILVVHVVDVEGTVLAVAIHWGSAAERDDQQLVAELDAVVASLRIEP